MGRNKVPGRTVVVLDEADPSLCYELRHNETSSWYIRKLGAFVWVLSEISGRTDVLIRELTLRLLVLRRTGW